MTELAGHSQTVSGALESAGRFGEIDDEQFAAWTNLLEMQFGLFIAPERRSFLASGLRARMRETGCENYREYYRQLSQGASQAKEWSMLIDCLTVHETCFFRHASSMRLVEEKVLPEAFEKDESFGVWSIGCATGEETYSLAMLIEAYRAEHGSKLNFGVTGTDISLPALSHARSGIYSDRRHARISGRFKHLYTRQVHPHRFEICGPPRERVCFSQLNLRDVSDAPFNRLGLIFCQNVLIYFDRERRCELADCLVKYLRPGGVLILGPGELLKWQHPKMERVRYVDTLAYRRVQA